MPERLILFIPRAIAKFFLLLLLGCLSLISFFTFAAESSNQINFSVNFQKIINSPDFQKSIRRIYKINNSQQKLIYVENKINIESQEYTKQGIPIGEEIILSLYIDKYYTSDLFAYKTKENAQISLRNLFELLDFPIEVNIANKTAFGWFINEQNHFMLNLPELEGKPATVIINEQKTSLNQENYYIFDDDIFVDANIIAGWFNFTTKFDFSSLNMIIYPQTPLPLQMKLARENKKTAYFGRREAVLPWRESIYQPISSPLVDIQLSSTVYKERTNVASYSILSSQDFAYLNSELFLSGNNKDSLSNLRVKFAKEDMNANLLGPLNATNYQFGDITPVKTALSNTREISRGLTFSNQKRNNTNNRTKTFSGNIQPGWDIELYRNGILIKKERSSGDGRYDFNDVPLLFGENQFQLIFYGPQGQVRTESYNIYIDRNALSAKQSRYAFSLADSTHQVFDVRNMNSPYQDGWLSTLTYEQGITNAMSLHGGIEWLAAQEGKDTLTYSLGADLNLFENLLLGSDFQIDLDKHKKASLLARTKVGGHSLAFNLSRRDSFAWKSPENVVTSDTAAFNMSGALFNDSVSYSNSLTHSFNHSTNQKANYFLNQFSFLTPFAYINNTLAWDNIELGNNTNNKFYGSTRFQNNFGSLSTRLQVGYAIKPDTKFNNIEANFSLPLTNDIYSELTFDYQPIVNTYKSKLGLNFKLFEFDVQSRVSYDSDETWEVGLNTHFSFAYEPITKQFLFSERKLAQHGLLMTRVFEDENANGIFDEGERLVEGVKVKALQHSRQAITNEDGVAVLNTLTNNKRTDIIIDQATVDDPFLIPATPGISLTPRRGFVEELELPLVNASELDGIVYIRDKQGNEKAGAYLTINIKNNEGKIVATTDTEFDGYYLFTNLVPGKYTVTIDADDIKRKNLHDPKAQEFDFSAAGNVIAGADFVIDRYTFVKGYVVDLGRFNSLAMLKTYWQIIKENYNNALQQQVFYTENADEQTFHLNAAFFKGKAQAKRACKYLEEKGISCSVKEFEFNL